MTITVYKSTDASAPVLDGVAGSFVTILDACLVNGYGAKAGAGYGIAFTATNKRVYRAASGNRMYLDVDDTAAQVAQIRGYEVATAVGTGTGGFPTSAQFAAGLFFPKSLTANTTSRPWLLIASDTMFYFFGETQQTVAPNSDGFSAFMAFGDFASYKGSDAYNTILIGNSSTFNNQGNQSGTLSAALTLVAGHYIPRAYLQTGSAVQVGKSAAMKGCYSVESTMTNSASYPAYPDTISGGVNFAEMFINESSGQRGKLLGMLEVSHALSSVNSFVANWDTIAGSGPYAGTTFIFVKVWNTSTQGWCAIPITGSSWT